MQVSTQEIPFREESSLSLAPLAQGSSVRPADTTPLDVSKLPASSNLLDLSNRFGFLVAATPSTGFVLSSTTKVKGAFSRNEAAVLPSGESVQVQTPAQVVFLRFAYADLNVVAVLDNGAVQVYSLKQLAQGQNTPINTYQLTSPALDLLPNPSDKPELLAVLLSSGQLALLDLTSASGTSPTLFGSQVVSACWSVKGKQIVAGLANASLVQFAPDGSEKGNVPAPSDLEEPYQTIDVRWLENDVFFVTCAPVNAPTDGLPPLIIHYIVLRTKTSLSYCRVIDDPTQPFGTHETRPARQFVAHLKAAGSFRHLLVLAASNSPDIALLGCDAASGSWAVLEVDDNARASLPTTSSGDNTCPFGLALDLTSSPVNETPCLVAYTSEASVIAWSLRSTSADLKSAVVATEDVSTASDQPGAAAPASASAMPSTPGTPAAKPFGASAVPAFSGKASFGQSAFGQSGFGSPSGFGTPSASPAPPASSGGSAFGGFSSTASASTGGSAFGGFAASTGQSGKPAGFGSFSASSSSSNIFGSAASTATPSFNSGTSTPSAFGAASRGRGTAMGDDDDDDEPRTAASSQAPGLGEMDADELEPQAKGDASASLGFGGGFGLGGAAGSKPANNGSAAAPANPMFGGLSSVQPSTSAPAQPAASGFGGFGQTSTGFGSSASTTSTPSAFTGLGKPAFGASSQTATPPPAATTGASPAATPAPSPFSGFGKPAFGAPAATSPQSSPAPSAFGSASAFGKPAFGASTAPTASSASSSGSEAASPFAGFGKPAFGASQPATTAATTAAPATTSPAPSAFSGFGQTKAPSFSFGSPSASSTPQSTLAASSTPAPAESKPSAFSGFGSTSKSAFGASGFSAPSVSSPLTTPPAEDKKPGGFAGFGQAPTGTPKAEDKPATPVSGAPSASPFVGFGKPSFSFGATTPSKSPADSKPEPPKFSFGSATPSPLARSSTPAEGEADEAEEVEESVIEEEAASDQEESVVSEVDETQAPEETDGASPEETSPVEAVEKYEQAKTPSGAATPAKTPEAQGEKSSPFNFPPAKESASAQPKPAFSFGSSFNFGSGGSAGSNKVDSKSSGLGEDTKTSSPFSVSKPATPASAADSKPATSPFAFGKPTSPALDAKPSASPFSFEKPAEKSQQEQTAPSKPTQDRASLFPSKDQKASPQTPQAAPSQAPTPGPSKAQQPQTEKTKAETQAEGLGAEFMKLIHLTDQELVKLQQQVEEKLSMLAQHKEPLQPVAGFPNSFDDGEWTMGDLSHLEEVSSRLLAVFDEVKAIQKKEQAGLLELQNSCVKAQLKCAEIQRFKENMANPEFHRQLKAQELGPEQAEMQQHLRSLTSVTQDSLAQLEGQVERVQERMTQVKSGRIPLKVSSLEMIHQTMRNLSISINAKLSELTELSTRIDLLTRPRGGRSKGGQRQPLSLQSEEPLFKTAVSEEHVGQLKSQARTRLTLRDVYLASKPRPRLNRSAVTGSDGR